MSGFYKLSPELQGQAMEALAVKALARWNIRKPELSLIKMRENAVFRVDTTRGDRFALRIHRSGYHSDDELRSELQWMRALGEEGIDVPHIVPSTGNLLFETVKGGGVPEPRQVDVFEWIGGSTIGASGEALTGDRETLKNTFHTMGELCARVHNQSEHWRRPKGFRRHAWDEDGLTGDTPLWGRFWELEALSDAQRDLVQRARARVHGELLAFGKTPDRYGLIHADLTPENVIVDDDRLRIIDFDDAGYGWHLFEIATALFFHTPENYYADIRDAMIAGYHKHRNLTPDMVRKLPLFLTARAFTYLGWVQTRKETQTAKELTPMLIELVCGTAEDYLAH